MERATVFLRQFNLNFTSFNFLQKQSWIDLDLVFWFLLFKNGIISFIELYWAIVQLCVSVCVFFFKFLFYLFKFVSSSSLPIVAIYRIFFLLHFVFDHAILFYFRIVCNICSCISWNIDTPMYDHWPLTTQLNSKTKQSSLNGNKRIIWLQLNNTTSWKTNKEKMGSKKKKGSYRLNERTAAYDTIKISYFSLIYLLASAKIKSVIIFDVSLNHSFQTKSQKYFVDWNRIDCLKLNLISIITTTLN